jgi:endonuclease YncB( thermonuclease family)
MRSVYTGSIKRNSKNADLSLLTRRVLALVLAIALPPCGRLSSAALAANSACPVNHGAAARVSAVEEGFALRLDDGRSIVPAAIDPPSLTSTDPQFGEHGREALAAQLVGKTVLVPPALTADRWGRMAAPVFAGEPAGAPPEDVSEMIVAEGWARVRPSKTAPACLPPLLGAEAAARAGRRGLWDDPAYAVLAADTPATFAGRFGTFQIVEGRVISIGQSGSLFYLNFGPRRGMDFAVVVAKSSAKTFDRAGLPLRGLLGRRIRARGLLDDDPGPHIDIGNPAWIELIEGT